MLEANPSAHSDGLAGAQNSVSAETISEYLELMEDTESPRAFHTWALITMAAALLGKHSVLRSGLLTVRPNLFTILIGPPALRKSTAIHMIDDLVRGTSLNRGPTDTGGQRHGLMSALQGLHRWDARQLHREYGSLLNQQLVRPRAPSDMILLAPELGRLWGSSNRDMTDFMLDLYDGARIDYETKAATTTIREPLVTLLGATTPSSFAGMMPENATSHGILSRLIFVYGESVYKSIPLPPEPTEEWHELRATLVRKLQWIDGNRRDFGLSMGARELYEGLYEYSPRLDDPRLETYKGRRANTLLRVAMAIAALRADTWLIESDIALAHELLKSIEPVMHKALESFGRNKAYQGRLVIIQFLKSQTAKTATIEDVIAAAASEMNRREAEEVLNSMAANKEITIFGGRVILDALQKSVKSGNHAQKRGD